MVIYFSFQKKKNKEAAAGIISKGVFHQGSTSQLLPCSPVLPAFHQAVGIAADSGKTEFLEFVIYPEIPSKECTDEHRLLFGRRLMSFFR
jgi:hypothetical protein